MGLNAHEKSDLECCCLILFSIIFDTIITGIIIIIFIVVPFCIFVMGVSILYLSYSKIADCSAITLWYSILISIICTYVSIFILRYFIEDKYLNCFSNTNWNTNNNKSITTLLTKYQIVTILIVPSLTWLLIELHINYTSTCSKNYDVLWMYGCYGIACLQTCVFIGLIIHIVTTTIIKLSKKNKSINNITVGVVTNNNATNDNTTNRVVELNLL